MPMEEALEQRLAAVPALVALGAGVGWDDRPKALPYVTLTKVSPGRSYTHAGADGLDGPRIQIDCWGDSKAQRAALERAVVPAMEAGGDHEGVRFHPAWLEDGGWDREEDELGGRPVFRSRMEFRMHHEEISS